MDEIKAGTMTYIDGLRAENAALRETLKDIQAEARSNLPVDGLYPSEVHRLRAKIQRIEVIVSNALEPSS